MIVARSLSLSVSALAIIALIAGCATEPRDDGFGDVRKVTAERLGTAAQWNRNSADDAATRAAMRRLLADELTADEAVQVALLNNPTLQATYEDLGIAQADLVQAGLLRNPIFEAEIRFPPDPWPPLEAHVLYEFLDLLYLPLRQKVAAAEFEAAKNRVASAALDLAADTRSAFYTLQGAEQMLEMRRTAAAATDASAAVAHELRRAGNITDLQLAQEEAMAGQAKLDLAAAEEAVVQDRERLNVLMGLWGPDTQWRVSSRLPDLPANEVAGARLESHAVAERLDVAAAGQAVAAAAQSVGLTRASQLFPDATVGGHFEREPDGTKTFGPSIEFPIPLFDQGQAKVARGAAMLRQARRRYEAAAVEARSQVRAAYARMIAARQRSEYYRRQVLPLYSRILDQTERQYNAMQVGVFALLQARQSQIDAGRSYIEALRDYWTARTELEKAVGGRLPGLPPGQPATGPAEATDPVPQPAATPGHDHPYHH